MVAALRIAPDEKPTRLKNRVGDFSAPAAARVGRRVDAARGPHWEKRAGDYDCTAAISFHENWNRFYDPQTGRYLSPEPLLQKPAYPQSMARRGFQVPAYAYASNNPLNYSDTNGKHPSTWYTSTCWANALGGIAGYAAGTPKASTPGDKVLHCTISCEISKHCGPGSGSVAGILKEICDNYKWLPWCSTAELEDIIANGVGEACALGDQGTCGALSCQDCCEKAYGKKP